jgi:hypothetical protein
MRFAKLEYTLGSLLQDATGPSQGGRKAVGRYHVCVLGEVFFFATASLETAQELSGFLRQRGQASFVIDTATGQTMAPPTCAAAVGSVHETKPPESDRRAS